MKTLTVKWKQQVLNSKNLQIFTYHKTLTYFMKRMGVESLGSIEPKPGVPPSASHILSLINLAKKNKKIRLALVENFYDPIPANKIKKEVANFRVAVIPVSVDGAEGVSSLEKLYSTIVNSF